MVKIRLVLLSLLVAGLLTGISYADQQVTLGASPLGTINFTGAGSTQISFTGNCGADCLSGFAYLEYNSGDYKFWITGGTPSLGAPSGNDFPILANGATLHLQVDIAGSQLVTTVALATLTDGSNAPRIVGTSTVQSVSGALFAGVWAVGQVDPFDFVVNLKGQPTVDYVYLNGGTTRGPISSGEVVDAVPEPGSLLLLGTGFAGLFGYLKRR